MSIFDDSDADSLMSDRLMLMAKSYLPNTALSPEFVMEKLLAAEQETSQQLKVLLEPTWVYPDPAPGNATDPFLVEPGYDYDPGFFDGERWGYLVTRQHPIIQVTAFQFMYPSPTNTVFSVPLDWLRIDRKYGHIRLVPASSQFSAPLASGLLQALGAGMTIPNMIRVTYQAGLTDAKAKWPALVDVIRKKAVLSIIEDTWPSGSDSISIDGMSQSMGVKLQDFEDLINLKLFGPKGANGGLWTAIHGVAMTALGTLG